MTTETLGACTNCDKEAVVEVDLGEATHGFCGSCYADLNAPRFECPACHEEGPNGHYSGRKVCRAL